LGDAAGYIEPFTGEGMSWGLAGASQLAKTLFSQSVNPDAATAQLDWSQWIRAQRASKQWVARWVARRARSVTQTRMALKVLDRLPPVRNFLLRKASQ
jgi:menaquinone-9 beta-reductase